MIRTLSVLAALAIVQPAVGQEHDHASDASHENAHGREEAPDLGVPEEIEAALAAGGALVTVDVLGMVCDFCATALNKTFGRRDEVAAVYVDLDASTLSVALAAGARMDDATITELVEWAGYKIDAIRRGDASATDAS